jgi:hypothetical protein
MRVSPVVSVMAVGLIFLSSGSAVLAGEGSPAKTVSAQPLGKDVVATVNGKKITVDLFDKVMQQAPAGMPAVDRSLDARSDRGPG